MFSRVAACSIAVLFVVMPAPSNGGTAAPVAQAAVQDLIPPLDAPRDQHNADATADRPHDIAGTPVKLTALDPAVPPPKPPAVAAPAMSRPSLAEPFGQKSIPVTDGQILHKWSAVEADIRAESEILARCRASTERCPTVAKNFLAIVAEGRAQSGRARLGVINRAINLAIRPTSDLEQWGVIDRWSAPLDTFTTGRGDCEDYAIAKYVALKEAGFDDDDVRLVIVRNTAIAEDHAMVTVRLDGDWIVLDNRWLTLVADKQMRGIVPLFVLDQNGVRSLWPAAPQLAAAPASAGSLSVPVR
jgi:predicted transglutaminase-like cysteine proteinase